MAAGDVSERAAAAATAESGRAFGSHEGAGLPSPTDLPCPAPPLPAPLCVFRLFLLPGT